MIFLKKKYIGRKKNMNNNCGLYSDPVSGGKCDKGYVASTIGTIGEWASLRTASDQQEIITFGCGNQVAEGFSSDAIGVLGPNGTYYGQRSAMDIAMLNTFGCGAGKEGYCSYAKTSDNPFNPANNYANVIKK